MAEICYKVEKAGTITPRRLYYFHQLRSVLREGTRVVDDVQGGLFRVEEYVYNNSTGQQMVLVRAVDGPRRGSALVCTPVDFCSCFRPAVESAGSTSRLEVGPESQAPPPAAPTAPRIAGNCSTDPGY